MAAVLMSARAISGLVWSLSATSKHRSLDFSRPAARVISDPWTNPKLKGVPANLSPNEGVLLGGFYSCQGLQVSNQQIHAHPVVVSLFFRKRLLARQLETAEPLFGFYITGMPDPTGFKPPTLVPFTVSSSDGTRAQAAVVSGGAAASSVLLRFCLTHLAH
jgi:hypothetical protein